MSKIIDCGQHIKYNHVMSYTKTFGVTINFDEWIENKSKQEDTFHANWTRDIDGLRYLDHKCNFSGFMTGPVGSWKGQDFHAITRNIDSIDEFVFHCEDLIGDKNIFLYDLYYTVGMPKYFEIDPNTFEPVFLDRVIEFPRTGWKVRFGEI